MKVANSQHRPVADFTSAAGNQYRVPRKHPSPITFRLTETERARLLEMSKGMGVSAYIRKCLFGKTATRRKHQLRIPIGDEQAIARALAMLGSSRIANNLNQLAYHANTGSLLLDDDTLRKIDEAYAHVCAMRAELISALGLKADYHQQ